MISQNVKDLYKHYLLVPTKARQAAQLLKDFPELAEKPKEPEPKKEVKPSGSNHSPRRPKR